MSGDVTDGEFALIVFIRPCTIQGWRPLSVSIQPAVFMTNGVTTAQEREPQEPLGVCERPPVQQPCAPQGEQQDRRWRGRP